MKTLVILLGNARGGEDTWKTLYDNLLTPYNADLALCFGKTDNKTSSLYNIAKYVWEMPEYNNWCDYYNQYFTGYWKQSFTTDPMSGLGGGLDNYVGSGAIIFAFRHFIKNNYSDILKKYDRIILTRSDHYYPIKQPILPNDSVWIVQGEDYRGITDRHHIFPSCYLNEMLGVVEYMDSEIGFNTIKDLYLKNYLKNPECVLLSMFNHNGIIKKIKRFPRFQFTVATRTDPTRWAVASVPLPENPNLLLKYPDEYDLTMRNLKNLPI